MWHTQHNGKMQTNQIGWECMIKDQDTEEEARASVIECMMRERYNEGARTHKEIINIKVNTKNKSITKSK